jgi:predicted N-acyltransferase
MKIISSRSTPARPASTPQPGTTCWGPGVGHALHAHEYLLALHESGSAVPATAGRRVLSPCIRGRASGRLRAVPEETHSYGEYVFDWAWADAYRRHGLAYYPKLLGAVPFTPVPGTRLLARSDSGATACWRPWRRWPNRGPVIGARAVRRRADRDSLPARGLAAARRGAVPLDPGRGAAPADFGDLLARLQRDKRKKIQQERRRWPSRASASPCTWERNRRRAVDFFHHCYTLTYQAHHSTPYLTRDFFARMAQRCRSTG